MQVALDRGPHAEHRRRPAAPSRRAAAAGSPAPRPATAWLITSAVFGPMPATFFQSSALGVLGPLVGAHLARRCRPPGGRPSPGGCRSATAPAGSRSRAGRRPGSPAALDSSAAAARVRGAARLERHGRHRRRLHHPLVARDHRREPRVVARAPTAAGRRPPRRGVRPMKFHHITISSANGSPPSSSTRAPARRRPAVSRCPTGTEVDQLVGASPRRRRRSDLARDDEHPVLVGRVQWPARPSAPGSRIRSAPDQRREADRRRPDAVELADQHLTADAVGRSSDVGRSA